MVLGSTVKKLFFVAIMLFLCISISAMSLCPRTASAGWVPVGQRSFSPGVASDISLYVYKGTPYVAFSDGNKKGRASVMRYNGSSWVYVGAAGFSDGLATDVSLYLQSGTPYVAYSDYSQGNRATVMKYNGLVWECVGNKGFSDGKASGVSLYGYNSTLYVAYIDGGHGDRVTVMRYNGVAWEPVGNAGFSTGSACDTSLYVSGGIPYVAYSDNSQNGRATVMKYEANNWITVGNQGFSAGQAGDVSLYVSGGTPYVAYFDNEAGGKVTVTGFVDGYWETVGKAGFSDGKVYNPSLDADSGILYVAYADENLGGQTVVMNYGGNGWVPVGQPGFSGVRAYDTSFFIHNGTPYVAFRESSSTKATVMKYQAVAITPEQSMDETNLDGCNLTVALTGDAFKDATLDRANFTLNNAPAGTTISDVAYSNATHCTLVLAFDGTDFDEDVTDFSVTISGDELSEGVALTSNTLVIKAQVESGNAGLAELILSGGTLTPAFDALVTAYTAVVDYGVNAIEVTATPADAGAGMMINGGAREGGVPFTVTLDPGDNVMEIVVTAPDGVTQKVYTVTVCRRSDTESPAWPAGSLLSATGTSQTGLTLVWNNALDNVGVTGYRVYRDGELLGTVAGSVYSYAVTGLAPGTGYTFCVQAGDAAGNWTLNGPATAVTTLPVEAPARKKTSKHREVYPEFRPGTIVLSDLEMVDYGDHVDILIPAGIVQKHVNAGVAGIVVELGSIDRPVNITFPAGVLNVLANKDTGVTLDTPWCDLVIPPDAFGPGGDVTVSINPPVTTGEPPGYLVVAGGVAGIQATGGEMRGKITLLLTGKPGMVDGQTGLFIYRIDENGSYTCEGGTLENGNVTINLNHSGQYAVLEFNNPFRDIAGHWAGRDILFITARGIAKGVAPNIFEPDREVTRAELAALLLRVLELGEYRPGRATFKDVDPVAWYYGAVEAAYRNGLLTGAGNGGFEPGRAVTRQEMAAIISRVLAETGTGIAITEGEKAALLAGLNDAPSVAPWALDAVARVVKSGLMKGNPDGSFAPVGKVTRAQAAAIISRLIQGSGPS